MIEITYAGVKAFCSGLFLVVLTVPIASVITALCVTLIRDFWQAGLFHDRGEKW